LQVANDFEGVGNKGFIKLDDTTYALPRAAFEVLQDRALRLEAPGQVYEHMYYSFAQWSDGSTANPCVRLLQGHESLTARYTAVRALPPPDFETSRDIGKPIRVVWSEHPNLKITRYQVWRRVKSQRGTLSPPVCVATLSRGATSWEDSNYELTARYTHDLISYSVRSYFSATSAYSEDEWIEVFGKPSTDHLTNVPALSLDILPAAYGIGHYPNPFNSMTSIRFTIADEAHVTVKVFDFLGREAAILVNEHRIPGTYYSRWDATKFPSGIYLCRFQTDYVRGGANETYVETRKLVLIK
jgi:hypothetical protein